MKNAAIKQTRKLNQQTLQRSHNDNKGPKQLLRKLFGRNHEKRPKQQQWNLQNKPKTGTHKLEVV